MIEVSLCCIVVVVVVVVVDVVVVAVMYVFCLVCCDGRKLIGISSLRQYQCNKFVSRDGWHDRDANILLLLLLKNG